MNNFTYFNDEWNSPIVEGTSQPPASPLQGNASPLMENSPTYNKPKNVQ
jgi:hypothetical protein